MKRGYVLLMMVLLAGTLWAQFAGTYEIYSAGQKIGECKFEFKKHPMGYVMTSKTTMTVAGTQTIYDAQTFYDVGYHPQSYSVSITTPSGKQEIEGKFERGRATIKASAGINTSEQKLTFPTNGYIIDQNVYAHFFPLNFVVNPRVGNIRYPIIVPQLMAVETLDVANEEEREYEGKVCSHFIGKLGSSDIELWIAQDNSRIIGIVFPTQKIEVKLTQVKSLQEESAKLPAGYHPIKPEELSDKDFMKPIRKCKKFKAHISFSPKGRLDRLYLNRRAQTFVGNIDQNSVDGTIEVRKLSHRVTLSGEWPPQEPLVSDPIFMSPAPGIDSDDSTIIAKAKAIVEPAHTVWDAARAINVWVNRNITYDMIRYGAKDAIVKGRGDALTKAEVAVAMLRAVGIPARVVRGILYADVPLDHCWVEVFLGPEIGWAPMDPTTGEEDEISARHISLWIGEQEPPVYAKDITIEPTKK